MKRKFLITIPLVILIFSYFSGCMTNEEQNEVTYEDGFVTFNYAPVDLGENLGHIKPMGLMGGGGHITPTDHMYFLTPDWFSECEIINDIFPPADGVVTSIQLMTSKLGTASEFEFDYRIVIKHTSTISSIFIHIDELSSKIAVFAPTEQSEVEVQISVEAGELIGRWRGQLDYSVVDADVTLSGFVNPDRYEFEDFKIHCADPFNYFNESIRSQMLEKNLRTVEPYGGKIDYDVDGRLIGTWFSQTTISDVLWEYNCISIAYDYLDPSFIVVSFGDYDGTPRVCGIADNPLIPADVSVETGVVKYELYKYWYVDEQGSWWDEESLVKNLVAKNRDSIEGVGMFQLIDDRTLKVEAFPNKTADEVDGFTDNYRIYER